MVIFFSSCDGDNKNYPECFTNGSCQFDIISWNTGSSNFWSYGQTQTHYYFNSKRYFDSSVYVRIKIKTADECTLFQKYDVLTWKNCDENISINCDWLPHLADIHDRLSSETSGSSKYRILKPSCL